MDKEGLHKKGDFGHHTSCAAAIHDSTEMHTKETALKGARYKSTTVKHKRSLYVESPTERISKKRNWRGGIYLSLD